LQLKNLATYTVSHTHSNIS